MKILFHILVSLYYASSITYIFCHTLSPRFSFKKTWIGCFFLIFISVLPHTLFQLSAVAGVFIVFSMAISCAVFFLDPLFNKIICFIIVYITQSLLEASSYLITDLIFYACTGKTHSANFLYNAPEWASFLMMACISLTGFICIPLLTPIYGKWIHHRLTKALAIISLPLIFPIYSTLLYEVPFANSHPFFVLAIYIVLYLLSYIPAYFGIAALYRQSKEYYLAKKQSLVIEQQLAYSLELEKQFNEIRKWNHDISNHLLALSYLFEKGLFSEAEAYIAPLIASISDQTETEEKLHVKDSNL